MRSPGIEVGQRFESQGLWRRTWQVEQVYSSAHDIRHVMLRDVGDRLSVRTLAPGALLDRKRFRPVSGCGPRPQARSPLAEAVAGGGADKARGLGADAPAPELPAHRLGGKQKRHETGKKQQRDQG